MAHGSCIGGTASRDLAAYCLLLALLYSTIGQTAPRLEHEPEFLAPLENHTVIQGRDVFFTCVVNHLQSYKVAWIKSDSRAILAMHTHMVAPNPRLSVTHNGHNTWKLHVVNVQPGDSGTYMCQVNTDPMRSQTGHMKVVIPPDIMDLDDSAAQRLTSLENGDVRLRCRATGNPQPEVTWRREDGRSIAVRTENARSLATKMYKGEHLHLQSVQRQEMGAYLCIASNGVPPSVSKRYYVNVLFKPTIKIREPTVYGSVNDDVTLECYVESSPKSLITWYTENGVKVASDERHKITEIAVNDYTYQINLTIRRLHPSDFRAYTCFTENSFGRSNANVRLREHYGAKTTLASYPHGGRKKLMTGHSVNKHRGAHNSLESLEKSARLETAWHNDDDEDDYEPKHIDGKYSYLPATPGAHYDSTDSTATLRAPSVIAGLLAVCALALG